MMTITEAISHLKNLRDDAAEYDTATARKLIENIIG